MTTVTFSHISLDDRGVAYIDGTRTRVVMIAMDKRNGLTPEQIRSSYPYLTLAQIHAALAYYYDHQAELDDQISREMKQVGLLRDESIKAGAQPSRNDLQSRLDREKRP